MQREDIKMLVKKWRDIYNDETLDYRYNSGDDANLQPLLKAALSEAGVVDYVTAPSAA